MKYIFLAITFLYSLAYQSNAQTLTDLTTNSDRMENIRASGFNWANPNTSNNARLDITYVCNDPHCPICGSNGGGIDDWETYSYNWSWTSYTNSSGFPYLGSGTIKPVYLISVYGLGGSGSYGSNPTYTIVPIIPPPLSILTPQTTAGSIKTPKDSTKKDNPYYITVDNDTTKYYNDSTIYLPVSNKNFKLKIHKDSTVLNAANYVWKKGSSVTLANGKDSCIYSQSQASYNTFSVTENTQLIKVSVNVIDLPYIVFEKKNNFNNEYGWDEESKNYELLREDFQKEPYGNRYTPKWMSVFHQKTVEVKVSVKDLNSNLQYIKDFYVYIKSNNPKIKINNDTAFKADYNTLQSIKTINITADELGSTLTNHLRDSIIPQTKDGKIIGKLYISCEKPITKKVVIVYVKTNSGSYPTNMNTALIDFLNNKSHNQLFRQWKIAANDSLGYYPILLDLSSSTKQNQLSSFTTNSQILNFLLTEYQDLYYSDSFGAIDSSRNVNLLNINQNPTSQDDDSSANVKTRFFFITDISGFSTPSGDTLKGATNRGGCYGFVTQEGQNLITVSHELAHALHLLHIFLDPTLNNYYPNTTKTTTNNFMDYYDISNPPDIRNKFYYYQWFHKPVVNGIGTGNFWIW